MTDKKTVIVFGCAASSVALRQRRLRGFSNSGRTFRLGTLLIRPGRLVVVRIDLLQKYKEHVLAALRSNIIELRIGITALSPEQAVALLEEREIAETDTDESTGDTTPDDSDVDPTSTDDAGEGESDEDVPSEPTEPNAPIDEEETEETPFPDPVVPPPALAETMAEELMPTEELEPIVIPPPPALPAQWEQLNKAGLVDLAKSLGLTVEDADTRKILSEKIRAR